MPKTKGDWFQIIAAVAYIGLAVAFYFILDPYLNDREGTKEQIQAAGFWGPLIYVAVYSLQVFIPFLPGVSMDFVAGTLWGIGGTVILSMAGATIGGAGVILVVRRLGLQTIDEKFPALLKGPWRFVRLAERWPWTLAIVCTIVGDVGYFVAGATRVKLWKTLFIIGVARLPSVLIYSGVGWAIERGMASHKLEEQFNLMVPAIGALTVVLLLVGVAILTRYGEGIVNRLEQALDSQDEAIPDEGKT
jgi:uncharacterized membrane protein YdjX (TVP38/TMEM64 family)